MTIYRVLSAITAVLILASCHDASRRNPLDPDGTPEVEIEVIRGDDGQPTVSWTPYLGEVEFSRYVVLRRNATAGVALDTVAVLDDRFVVHISRPDTVAVISDRTQNSFTDTSVVANARFAYSVSVFNTSGFESRSAESLPVEGPVSLRIAFYTNRDGNGEVYVMNPDGSFPLNLTNTISSDGPYGAPGQVGRPAWSPDGLRIAFCSTDQGNTEINSMNADGSHRTRLTDDEGLDWFPRWSPDGSRIAFMSNRDGDFDVYVMEADETNVIQLTDNPGWDGWPTWSPDGSRIAFTSLRDGDHEIYLMNADGTDQKNLTNSSDRSDWDADWSPDGSRIAWESGKADGSEGGDVYVMDADGTNIVNLTNSPQSSDLWPDWSPDGSRIAFTSGRDGNLEIYVMDADGSNPVNITNNPASDSWPDWQPVLPR